MLTFITKLTDESIINGLLSGGKERRIQENKLYETFFYLIRQGVLKHTLSEEDAASVYSDTIISVINNIVTHKFEGRSSLKSYVYKIYMNNCISLIRKETTNKNSVHHTRPYEDLIVELPDNARSIIQQIIDNKDKASLLQKLKEIGEKCKQILLLFEDGYSDKEIATEMQYNSADVAKTSRLRCLEKLKEKFINSKHNYE